MPQPTVHHSRLLADHTFVVQLHATTRLEAGQMTGRVEHLVSRQATMFASLEALMDFMARMLQEVRQDRCPAD
jgi:hypothetical protein